MRYLPMSKCDCLATVVSVDISSLLSFPFTFTCKVFVMYFALGCLQYRPTDARKRLKKFHCIMLDLVVNCCLIWDSASL